MGLNYRCLKWTLKVIQDSYCWHTWWLGHQDSVRKQWYPNGSRKLWEPWHIRMNTFVIELWSKRLESEVSQLPAPVNSLGKHGVNMRRCSSWRWRQQASPKRWYPSATLHGVTIQKTKALRNIAVLPQHYTAWQSRRPGLESCSSPWWWRQ